MTLSTVLSLEGGQVEEYKYESGVWYWYEYVLFSSRALKACMLIEDDHKLTVF